MGKMCEKYLRVAVTKEEKKREKTSKESKTTKRNK
jgi:hypothetical protein